MQQIELWLIVASALALLVLAALRSRRHLAERPLLLGAIFGIVPGILGALVVLVPRTDLIPDEAEPGIWILVGLIGSGIALLATSIGLARR